MVSIGWPQRKRGNLQDIAFSSLGLLFAQYAVANTTYARFQCKSSNIWIYSAQMQDWG
jgi:hypothetical protein